VRVLAPPLVAAGIALGVALYLWRFDHVWRLSVLLPQALAGIALAATRAPLEPRPRSVELVLQRGRPQRGLVMLSRACLICWRGAIGRSSAPGGTGQAWQKGAAAAWPG